MSKKIHLVLGSGGARGIAHIGVIEMLETEGFDIISVTGCSMGAVIGAMYCSGHLPEYKKWLLSLTKTSVFNLFDFTFSKQGFVKGDKVLKKLKEFIGEQEIENFSIPFTAVATDLWNKKEIYFKSGNLYKALRASIGIPGVFIPVSGDNYFMVDGGVLNPLPINLVNKKEHEMIVAVNLNGPATSVKKNSTAVKQPEDIAGNRSWLSKHSPFKSNGVKAIPPPAFSFFDLLNTSYDLTQDRLTQLMIQIYRPDLLIEIPRNACAVFEFYRAGELIKIGMDCYKNAQWEVPVK